VGVESPFVAGQEVSIQKAREIECEGSDYLVLSGTGALAGNTAVGTALSFKDGKLRQSQPDELVNYKLSANGLPPMAANALRIRAEAV